MKIEERKIILSRDCSYRATERSERQPIGDSFDLKIGKKEKWKLVNKIYFRSTENLYFVLSFNFSEYFSVTFF